MLRPRPIRQAYNQQLRFTAPSGHSHLASDDGWSSVDPVGWEAKSSDSAFGGTENFNGSSVGQVLFNKKGSFRTYRGSWGLWWGWTCQTSSGMCIMPLARRSQCPASGLMRHNRIKFLQQIRYTGRSFGWRGGKGCSAPSTAHPLIAADGRQLQQ